MKNLPFSFQWRPEPRTYRVQVNDPYDRPIIVGFGEMMGSHWLGETPVKATVRLENGRFVTVPQRCVVAVVQAGCNVIPFPARHSRAEPAGVA